MKKCIWFFISVLFTSFICAQTTTDIILMDMSVHKGIYSFGKPVNVTNREGYDNQPCFSKDGKILYYTSIRKGREADIFHINLATGKHSQLTKTQEAEYSPTPLKNGKELSTVRVEKDKTQRIWVFPIHGGEPKLIAAHVDQIGYHCWLNETTVAVFRIEKTMNLKLIYTNKKETKNIATNIGRCLALTPTGELSYLSKSDHKIYQLTWQKSLFHKRVLATALQKSEDFVWSPSGDLLMASGPKLYKCHPPKDAKWTLIWDGAKHNLGPFTRLAISQNKIALVSARK